MTEAIDRAIVEMTNFLRNENILWTLLCAYHSKRRVEEYKIDPITQVLDVIMDKKYATEEEIEVIEQSKSLVQECVDFAEESDYPSQQLYDVVRTRELSIHPS
jgi:pyruvate dehydrogenase E1 component alpha subunit